jgi:biopolymer transport protein TolR
MAGGMDIGQSGKGGKKPLDAAINLVPFIDLMAVTISFLIMTAVWTQIGRLQVSQAGGSAEEDPQTETAKTVQLTLMVSPTELRLTADQTAYDPITVTRTDGGRLDLVKLTERFKELKANLPDQVAITVQPEDKVRYDDLVRIIDECIGAGLPQVSLAATTT